MPGVTFNRSRKHVIVSQSFLSTAKLCPQRAWFEWRDPRPYKTDATLTGTMLHLFMQLVLTGETVGSSMRSAHSMMDATIDIDPTFRFKTVKTPGTMHAHLEALMRGFERDVLPYVPPGGEVEQTFQTPLLTTEDGWTVTLEGTPDYTDPKGRTWDWKTSATDYNVYEKDQWEIQPSAYTLLNTRRTGVEHHDFRYVVGIKPHGSVQYLDTWRGEGHWLWLGRVALGVLNLMRALPDGGWPVDHAHYLCSPKWCSWWDECRGAEQFSTAPVALSRKQ